MTKGTDIFRMKGVLSIKGETRTASSSRAFTCSSTAGRTGRGATEPRHNTLIFIGRNLDRDELTEGFRSCLA